MSLETSHVKALQLELNLTCCISFPSSRSSIFDENDADNMFLWKCGQRPTAQNQRAASPLVICNIIEYRLRNTQNVRMSGAHTPTSETNN
jgi:hypothetical protein